MILYFSATGNNKYVAQELSEATGERMVALRDLVRKNETTLSIADGEDFGVVMPTYWEGLPARSDENNVAVVILRKGTVVCDELKVLITRLGEKHAIERVFVDALCRQLARLEDMARNKTENPEAGRLAVARERRGVDEHLLGMHLMLEHDLPYGHHAQIPGLARPGHHLPRPLWQPV